MAESRFKNTIYLPKALNQYFFLRRNTISASCVIQLNRKLLHGLRAGVQAYMLFLRSKMNDIMPYPNK